MPLEQADEAVTEREKMRRRRKRCSFGGGLHLLMRGFARNTNMVAAEREREVELKQSQVDGDGKADE